jgi:hypothetical protein
MLCGKNPKDNAFQFEKALILTLCNPKKAYLTHISHIMGYTRRSSKNLPDNVFLAYDNLEITINFNYNENIFYSTALAVLRSVLPTCS